MKKHTYTCFGILRRAADSSYFSKPDQICCHQTSMLADFLYPSLTGLPLGHFPCTLLSLGGAGLVSPYVQRTSHFKHYNKTLLGQDNKPLSLPNDIWPACRTCCFGT